MSVYHVRDDFYTVHKAVKWSMDKPIKEKNT